MRTIAISTIALLMFASAATVHANGPMGSAGPSTTTTSSKPGNSGMKPTGKGSMGTFSGGPSRIPVRSGPPVRSGLPIGPGTVYTVVRTVHNPAYPVYQVIGRTLINVTLPVYSIGNDPNYQRQAVDAYRRMSGGGEVGGMSLRQAMDD